MGASNKEEGDVKGSVSRLGNVSMGGIPHIVGVDVGGSEGGSFDDNKLNGMGIMGSFEGGVGVGTVPWEVERTCGDIR